MPGSNIPIPDRLGRELSKYAVVLGAVGGATLLRLSLTGILGSQFPFPTYFMATILVVKLAGEIPSLLAAGLGYLAAQWFFVMPHQPLAVNRLTLATAGLYSLVSLFFIGVASTLRRDRFRAQQAAETARQIQCEVTRLNTELRSNLQQREQWESEREGLLEAVEANRSFLETVLRQLPAGVLIADAATDKLLFTNDQLSQILHRPFDPQDRRGDLDLRTGLRGYYPDGRPYRPEDWPLSRALLKGEDVRSEEIELRDSNEKANFIDVSAAPVRDRQGQTVAAVVVLADATARRESQAALAEADRRKDEFLATLAHELRNPLAPIRSTLEIMRQRTGDPQVTEKSRRIIERQVEQMVRLVDDLMEVSRISRGKIELRREEVSLGEIFDLAVETSRPAIEAGKHPLQIQLPENAVRLSADRTRLGQVLSNLLNNAAKFSAAGTPIWLTAQMLARPEGQGEGGRVEIRVRDRGVGVPAQMLSKIFDMFTQVDQSLERRQGGLGIGLSLVHGLVEMHGGTVKALSEGAGLGSEFVIELPAEEIKKEGRVGASSDLMGSHLDHPVVGNGRKILVVDDNDDAAESLAELLKMLGHELCTAHDGPAALELAASFHPDWVLLDIGMPGMSGYDVAKALRARHDQPRPVLVALTGWGQEENRRLSREAGFDHHLVKPPDLDRLERMLAEPGP